MAQYKVPQDVEADDKLLGPFSFRQFIYLMIAGGLIVLAVALFRIFPLLALIPLPIVFFFTILALPLKKDQPMETYLAALVSFYIKPRKRFWTPGQRDSIINITAPKIIEKPLTRDISSKEADHRLSFLAEVIDTEGRAIKNPAVSPMRDDFAAEATMANDMFDNINTTNINKMIDRESSENHAEAIQKMRQAIDKAERLATEDETIKRFENSNKKALQDDIIVQPISPNATAAPAPKNTVPTRPQATAQKSKNTSANTNKPSIIDLANNPDFSIQTIQQQANRINENLKEEVYIPLH